VTALTDGIQVNRGAGMDRAAHRAAFDEEALLSEARRTSGLDDYGGAAFRAPLRVLLHSLREEAPLNAAGIATMRTRILESLLTRLRAEDWIRRNPEIASEEIAAPIVVVGQTRTGTTMLHRLLASDPRHHGPLWWEVRFPAPLPGARWDTPDPRIAIAQAEIAAILAADPEQAAIHPWDALAPDEEIMLLEHAFMSHVPESFTNLPTYRTWLDAQDWAPAYWYLRRLLQFLQWQKRKRDALHERWVLKTPGHLGYLDTLLAVFPGALIVQTHRDPVQTIPSAASLNRSLWGLSNDHVDPVEVGRQWQQRMARSVARCLASRDRIPERQIADVWFQDALTNPVHEVERIYARFGIEMTREARAAMEQWLRENRRDKRPAHEYTLEEFGLSEADIQRDFAAYRRRFIEPRLHG
jgi:hypothetical protein